MEEQSSANRGGYGGFGGYNRPLQVYIGWASAKFAVDNGNIGADAAGASWALSGPDNMYMHQQQSRPVSQHHLLAQQAGMGGGGMGSSFGAPAFGGGGFGSASTANFGGFNPFTPAAPTVAVPSTTSSLMMTAEAAKAKQAAKSGGFDVAFSFKAGAVIGVGVDFDSNTMWYSLHGTR